MVDLAGGQLGPEAKYDVSFSNGSLVLSATYQGAQASFTLGGSVSGAQLVAALAAKVTNPLEKAILQGLEAIIAGIQ